MTLKSFDLTGKVAMVTGCNTGLGRGMAVGLAQAGADIIGVSLPPHDEVKQEIEALGRRFLDIRADLSSLEPIDRIMSTALAEYGRIDILVNNAGIIRREDALQFSEKDWDDVINVNLKTLFFLSQAVGDVCREGDYGKIINIASMLSYQAAFAFLLTSSKSGHPYQAFGQ